MPLYIKYGTKKIIIINHGIPVYYQNESRLKLPRNVFAYV